VFEKPIIKEVYEKPVYKEEQRTLIREEVDLRGCKTHEMINNEC
jgi:hypothetical protein